MPRIRLGRSLARGLGGSVGRGVLVGRSVGGGTVFGGVRISRWVLIYNILPEVMAAVEANADLAVQQTAEDIVREARARAPVRTGYLRSSIGVVSNWGKEADIGAGAPYAPYVEFGTYKMAAQPFLYPAVVANADKFFDRVGRGFFAKFKGA
jgi:HK97 gp10 family phage protein